MLIGRPYVYGLVVAGEAGVRRVPQLIRDETQTPWACLARAIAPKSPVTACAAVARRSGVAHLRCVCQLHFRRDGLRDRVNRLAAHRHRESA